MFRHGASDLNVGNNNEQLHSLQHASTGKQLWLLTRKNALLQKRRPCATCLELFVPCFLIFILAIIRLSLPSDDKPAVVYCSTPVSPLDIQRPLVSPNSANLPGNQAVPCKETLLVTFDESTSSPNPYNAVAFAPNNAQTQDIMDRFKTYFLSAASTNPSINLTGFQFVGMDTEGEVGSISESTSPRYILGVVFYTDASGQRGGLGVSGNKIHYTFRMPDDLSAGDNGWDMSRNFPEFQGIGPRDTDNNYYKSNFVMMQTIMDLAIMGFLNPTASPPTVTVRAKAYPFPEYSDDSFVLGIRSILPLVLVLSYLYTALSIVRVIVMEKEKRLKEALKMMGMKNWVYWLSWFIKCYGFLTISLIISIIIFSIGKIAENSDNFYVFVLFMLFGASTVFFCFLVSTFFSSANVASAAGGLLFFMAYFPYLFMANRFDSISDSNKLVACLLAPTCMGIGTNILSRLESTGEGLNSDTVSQGYSDEQSLSMAHVYGMMILDCFIYMILAWYIEAVMPGQYGIPQPWYFFATKRYWFGHSNRVGDDENANRPKESRRSLVDYSKDIEPEPAGVRVGINVVDLRKEFQGVGGTKVAVDNLNLRMYDGQITALLGHNGAGKTTAMSIMVGLFPPTSGTVYINGYDVRTETAQVRQSLGLCPQFDVLWDDLTVEEHLRFFAELKGMTGPGVKEEVDMFVHDLNLTGKAKERTSALSGGQKRALSVSLALVGGSKIVVLDEPTSGMDPFKRRQTWDLLLKHKAGRTMLLTTHFMDEADLLGDRIAILTGGQLRCAGTSLFLKQQFGVGYHMTLVKDSTCNVPALLNLLKSYVPSMKLESDAGAEISVLLPREESENFPPMFEVLEKDKAKLGIASYGVSMTTMEEVFLKVGQGSHASLEERRAEAHHAKGEAVALDMQPQQYQTFDGVHEKEGQLQPTRAAKLTGNALWGAQFRAMLFKKYIHSLRNRRTFIAQIILPVLFAIIALAITESSTALSNQDERLFTLTEYKNNWAFRSDRDTAGDFYTGVFPTPQQYLENEGDQVPSAGITSAYDATAAFFASDSRMSNAVLNVESNTNLSSVLTSKARNYARTQYFRKNIVGYSFGPGVVQVRSAAAGCEINTGSGGWTAQATLTLALDSVYHFRLSKDNAAVPDSLRVTSDAAGTTELTTNQTTYKSFNGSLWSGVYYAPSSSQPASTFLFCAPGKSIAVTVAATTTFAPPGATAYAYFNNEANHALGESVNFLDNIILRNYLGDNTAAIYTYNHPLPKSVSTAVDDVRSDPSGFNLALFMLFGLAFALASFLLLPILERVEHAKHIQLVSGVSKVVYWMATYVWDFAALMVTSLCVLIVFACFDVKAFRDDRMGIVLLILVLYAWSGLPFVYIWSFYFATPSAGFARISMMMIFLGLGLLIAVFVISLPSIDYTGVANVIKIIGCLLPNYAVGQAYLDMFYNYNYNTLCQRNSDAAQSCEKNNYNYYSNYLSWEDPGVGRHCLAMFLGGLFYWFILYLIEMSSSKRQLSGHPVNGPSAPDTESDVLAEAQRVHRDGSDLVVARDLVKMYIKDDGTHNYAVNGLSFGIPKGECFGLLGVNGAGKSTTFRMLTGEEPMSYGQVAISGHDLESDMAQARKHMGYCPQYDGLIPTMTGRELLWMFGRLRGIPHEQLNHSVDEMVAQLDLLPHQHKLCGTYSGGNKRKLSTAAAMIGDPDVIFLDEPSSGMDPGARRFIWDALTSVLRKGQSIVLTSHSMEECEALCTRLAIMVDGKFMCIGSIQSLKNKYGQGYTLKVKMDPEAPTEDARHFIESSFPHNVFKEEHNGEVTYQIVKESRGWSYMFSQLEQGKRQLGFRDYAVSQTSLEQVFLGFAARQASMANKGEGGAHAPPSRQQSHDLRPPSRQTSQEHGAESYYSATAMPTTSGAVVKATPV